MPMRTRGSGRFAGFLLASGLLITAVVVAAGLLVGRFFEDRVLVHEVDHLADEVRLEARRHLAPTAFELTAAEGRASGFAQVLVGVAGLFRLKAFDLNGRIVWSDEPRLIGNRFPDNPSFIAAAAGTMTTVFGSPAKRDNLFERDHRYVVEVYVPIILPGSAQVVGVIEVYKDTTQVVLSIQRTQRSLWIISGATGLLLYVGLAVIAWRASTGEWRAISQLEKQNRDLIKVEARLKVANDALLATQAQLVKKERLAAVGQVVVGLHHTILNPLTGILGALQVLKQGFLDPSQQAQAIAEAEQQVGEIERTVKRLRNLQQADGVPYLGTTTMLDLEPGRGEDDIRSGEPGGLGLAPPGRADPA
jgi:phospho-acceptor domain-containing protein